MTIRRRQVDVGDQVPSIEWTPTREFVQEMMGLSGGLSRSRPAMATSRFTSEDVARREGFGGMIVPGNLGIMTMAAAVQRWLPGAFIRKLDCVFRQPLPQGQKVVASGVVTDRREEDGQIVLELDLYLEREDGQRPQGCVATVVLPQEE